MWGFKKNKNFSFFGQGLDKYIVMMMVGVAGVVVYCVYISIFVNDAKNAH
jgi:hypothetical protein